MSDMPLKVGAEDRIKATIREMMKGQVSGAFCIDLTSIYGLKFSKPGWKRILAECAVEDVDYQWEIVDDPVCRSGICVPMATPDAAIKIVKAATDRSAIVNVVVSAISAYKSRMSPAGRPPTEMEADKIDDVARMVALIMDKIEAFGIGRRNEFPQRVIDTYAAFLSECRSGKCPISQTVVIGPDGKPNQRAHVDHFYSRSFNSLIGGWIISADENNKLKDTAYRAQVTGRFTTFHADLKEWRKTKETEDFLWEPEKLAECGI
jgi:hypothetical protein